MDLSTMPLWSIGLQSEAHTDPELRAVDGHGTEYNLFANPVAVNQTLVPGVFNPFAIREVREALNYLVDRDFLDHELFGGFASTHVAPWNNASSEVNRNPFFFADLNRATAYDFDRAKALIFDALSAAGATYDGVIWTWQGNPILIPLIIRIEDSRLDLGNYVADQLERLGLPILRQYMSGAEAFETVYTGPPDVGNWMLYTEGWATSEMRAWPDSDLNHFHCGGEGSAVWFFYAPPAALQDSCSRLSNGQYADEAERRALIEGGVRLALNESVRVWLLAPRRTQAYSARVVSIATDGAVGLQGPLALRTARFASSGGVLKVGQPLHLASPFQPWLGLNWAYDRVIANTFMDSGLVSDPRTGERIPMRAGFEATTAGPDGSLIVPEDALTWDPISMGFATVGPGTTSKSRVTFRFTFGLWHDGAEMSMDDVLYHVALVARRDRGDIAAKDPLAVNGEDRAFMNLFRGLKVADETTIDLYLDYWHVSPSAIAATGDIWPTIPWQVGELAMATTLHDHTRVHPTTAQLNGLATVDLSRGPTIGFMDREISGGNVTTSGTGVTRPPGLDAFIDPPEAEERWATLQAWRSGRSHHFVSNGPYFLDSIDPAGGKPVTVTAFADYPFPADRWDDLLSSPAPDLSIDPISDVVPGEPGRIDLTTTISGLPSSNASVRFRIRAEGDATTLLTGDALSASDGAWEVLLPSDFTAGLNIGTYLFQAVANGSNSVFSVYRERPFLVTNTRDTIAPSSSIVPVSTYWRTTTLPIDIEVSSDESGVASVDLYVAYNASGSWSLPTWAARDSTPPFSFDYSLDLGDGRYRFWALATDGAGNAETLGSKPAEGDLEAGFDSTGPTSNLAQPAGYWHRSVPIAITVDASDATSGVAAVALIASYSSDGISWATPSLGGMAETAPFTLAFAPSEGNGRYRLWAVALDEAGNVEDVFGKPPSGEIELGLDTTAPTILSANPVAGATGVAVVGTVIRVTFSEAVDHATAEAAFSISPSVEGTFSWEGNTLVFAPTGGLAAGTEYTVRVGTGVADPAGNTLAAEYAATFMTASTEVIPGILGGWMGTAFVIAAVLAIALAVVWFRSRRKRGGSRRPKG